MSQILFDDEAIQLLGRNPYVKRASQKAITYADEFKEKFMQEYEDGKYPAQIFRDAGFDVDMLGKERIMNFKKRCKKMVVREAGFTDTRKANSGRPTTREFSLEEQLERLKHKIKYLEQENEFLKKIEFPDKQAEWAKKRKQRQKKNSDSSKK